MTTASLRVLAIGAGADDLPRLLASASDYGPFHVDVAGSVADAVKALAADGAELLWIHADAALSAEAVQTLLAHNAASDLAVVLVSDDAAADTALGWWRLGVQEVLLPDEACAPSLGRRLRAAVERQRLQREARKTYATDLGTGLPHQQQLIEHMSHLLALREREPSPMGVLALRIEGFSSTEARYGRDASNVLRRKVAVRLRAGVRASDVVATLSDDMFGVLLAAMLAPADAQRVGEKLLRSLRQPFKVAGQEVAVAAALGVAQHPQDGTQPDMLLGRAIGLALSSPASGRTGLSNFVEAGGRAPSAANDDS